ncbi:MAG: hypothetical protein ABI980_05890 [Nitrospirota bacterium]
MTTKGGLIRTERFKAHRTATGDDVMNPSATCRSQHFEAGSSQGPSRVAGK